MNEIAAPALSVQTEMISRIETSAPSVSVPVPVTTPEKAAARESVTQAMPLTKKRKRWQWPVGLAILMVGLPVSLLVRNALHVQPDPAVTPANLPMKSPESSVSRPVAEPIPATPATAEPVHLAPVGARVGMRPARKSSAARETASVDCSVPFVVGPDGIRRVKRECLKSLSSDKP
jgi:hypothetical protein